jgi:hypothetical protein
MLVICAGMLRSGSTWQYQVACELVRGAGRTARPLGYLEGPRLAEFLAAPVDPNTCYLYKTHPPDPVHLSLDPASVRVLYSYRDLRDVAYSMAHKLGGSGNLNEVRELRILQQVIKADAFWRAMQNVSEQRYETWVVDNLPFVRLIAEALRTTLPETTLTEVADSFALHRNRARAESLAVSLASQGVDLSDRVNALSHDPLSLLHWNHIRGGVVGGWRAVATPDDKAYLAACCGDWLVANNYEPDRLWAGEIGIDTASTGRRNVR